MPPFLRRITSLAAILVAVLATAGAQAQELPAPHLIHEYEGWVALAVAVFSLVGAAWLIRRALRR